MQPMADLEKLEAGFHLLEVKVAHLDGWRQGEMERYDRLERDVGSIKDELHDMSQRFEARFERIDERLERMDERFERIDERFVGIDGRIDELGNRLDGRIDELANRLDGRIDQQGRELGARIDRLDTQFQRMMWLMMGTLASVLANLIYNVAGG